MGFHGNENCKTLIELSKHIVLVLFLTVRIYENEITNFKSALSSFLHYCKISRVKLRFMRDKKHLCSPI